MSHSHKKGLIIYYFIVIDRFVQFRISDRNRFSVFFCILQVSNCKYRKLGIIFVFFEIWTTRCISRKIRHVSFYSQNNFPHSIWSSRTICLFEYFIFNCIDYDSMQYYRNIIILFTIVIICKSLYRSYISDTKC